MATFETITKTYCFKLRMNRIFEEACFKALNASRFTYNCALEHRINHYQQTGHGVSYYEQSRQLTEARAELPEVAACLRTIQMDALERLDDAFKAFFRRLKAGEKEAGFPRFKGRDRYDTFTQQIEVQRGCPLKGDKLTVPGVGSCRVRLSREIEGRVKQLRISRKADGWYALLVCDLPQPEALPATGAEVGLDVGITAFATLSTGERISNPRCLKQADEQLKREQRKLSRKRQGSWNRKKARRKVALRHLKVSRTRQDFHHQEARKLVDDFEVIRVEDLNVRGMVKNHHLAQAISDVAWSSFFGILKAKAEEAGRQVEKVDPRYTSQTCSRCGHRQKMPLSTRVFECERCQLLIDRDHNAALTVCAGGAKPQKPVESDGTLRNRNRHAKKKKPVSTDACADFLSSITDD